MSAPNGPDEFAGGAGRDTVTYVNLALPVSVTPDGVANDGASGESDNVRPDNEVLVGGSAGDTLTGSDRPDTLDGGKGDDNLSGLGGDDVLRGGANDGGADTVMGGSGADSIAGGPGDDRLDGQAGSDELDGGGGADRAAGGADADRVSGGAGLDALSGGPGNDTLRGASEGLVGADGADTLAGGGGNDDLDGGPGDDTLAGGHGADVLAGATGRDTADYSYSARAVTATLDSRAGDGARGEGDFILANVEGLRGGRRADRLIGNRRRNTIAGGGGGDFIDGRAGEDTLGGGRGADTVRARDRSADRVDCGRERDSAIVDEHDRVRSDCERVVDQERRPPRLGRSFVVRPLRGATELRLPEAERPVPLVDRMRVPVGTRLDARDGAVRVTTTRGGGGLQAAIAGGQFVVRQSRRMDAGVEFALRGGDFADCTGDEVVRTMRARGAGRFRSVGRASVTTTTGRASWVVVDRCDGTLTRVRHGQATVLDIGLGDVMTLTGPDSYLARKR